MATEHQTYKVKWKLSNIVKKENQTLGSPLGNCDRESWLIWSFSWLSGPAKFSGRINKYNTSSGELPPVQDLACQYLHHIDQIQTFKSVFDLVITLQLLCSRL